MIVYARISLLTLIMILFGVCPMAAQEYAYVLTNAAAPILGDNFDEIREKAISEVKTRCVKKILRTDLLNPAEYEKYAGTLDEMFLSKPDAYIARFAIENEEIIDNGQRYRVNASAKVYKKAMNIALLSKGIGDVFKMGPKPTVMVLLRERFETRVSGTRTAETEMIKMLQEKGFKVIDPEQKKLVDLRNRLFAEGTGKIKAALQTAMSFKANYLIFGEAVVSSSGPLSGTDLKARYVNLSLKIVESSSGRIMATEKASGKTKHIDELTGGNWALEDAAQKAGSQVLTQFKTVILEELQSGAEIMVDVYGLDYESQAKEAETVLKEIKNVGSVFQRFWFSGVGQFDVKFKGAANGLAKALKHTEIDGQPLVILETLPRYLRIERSGGQNVVKGNSKDILKRYLDEKYKQFDMEKAREKDTELIAKINKLAQSQKASDEQKKQLYNLLKELEEKRKEATYRQQELKKAEAKKKEIEKINQNLKQSEAENKKQISKDLKGGGRQVQEVNNTRAAAYTASQNYSNAYANASSSSIDYISTINQGINTARNISSFLSWF